MRAFLACAVALGVLSGCRSDNTAVVRATINFGARSRAQCIVLGVKNATTTPRLAAGETIYSPPFDRPEGTSLIIAVPQTDALSPQVELVAQGYLNPCGTPGATDALKLNEESTRQSRTFVRGEVIEVALSMDGPATDVDGDGYRDIPSIDCVPTNSGVNPGAKEAGAACQNGFDDDCDGLTDCADPACDNQPCPAGGCAITSVCSAGHCVTAQAIACDAPSSICQEKHGACDGGSCSYSNLPVNTPCQYLNTDGGHCGIDGLCHDTERNCADKVDNDGDGKTDCADTDCESVSCTDDNMCTTGDSCIAFACVPNQQLNCGTVGVCEKSRSCFAATGCNTQLSNLGDACLGTGVCNGDGGCFKLGFDPVNFTLAGLARVSSPINVQTNTTFDSTTLTFTPPMTFEPAVTVQNGDAGEPVVVLSAIAWDVAAAATLTLTGSRPVILMSYGNFTVAGKIISGKSPTTPGSGASTFGNPKAHCLPFAATSSAPGDDSCGGGGGGAFAGPGAAGGSGPTGTPGGDGGQPNGSSTIVPLRGGCNGGNGTPNSGGAGGGALQLTAGGTLPVTSPGVISAPGVGGLGGNSQIVPTRCGGGGGGGSGGAVVLQASTVVLQSGAWVSANGGGGGSGDANPLSTATHDGAPGNVNSLTVAAGGQAPNTYTGAGGTGAIAAVAPAGGGAGGTTTIAGLPRWGNGGGGGGSIGRIWIRGVDACAVSGAQFSPAPLMQCGP